MTYMEDLPDHFRFVYAKIIGDINTLYGKKIKNSKIFDKQTGAGKPELVEHIDINGMYTFIIRKGKALGWEQINIISKDEVNCGTISIDGGDAMIQTIAYDKSCALEGLISPGGGNILLRFMLNYIIKIKDKYEIEKIIVTDKSRKRCKKINEDVELSRLMMIVKGYTWYMKYGFRPYNGKSIDKYKERNIKNNREKLRKLRTKNIPIVKIIKKNKINIDKREIERLIKNNKLFRDFMIALDLQFNRYCILIKRVQDYVYGTNILSDVHNIQYYLDISSKYTL